MHKNDGNDLIDQLLNSNILTDKTMKDFDFREAVFNLKNRLKNFNNIKNVIEELKSKLDIEHIKTNVLKLHKNENLSLLSLVEAIIDENVLRDLSYNEITILFEYGSLFMHGNGMEEFTDELTPLSDYLIYGIVYLLMDDSEIIEVFKHNII